MNKNGWSNTILLAERAFRAATNATEVDLYLTAEGLDDLWSDLCGADPDKMASFPKVQDGDEVWGMIVHVIADAGPYRFFLAQRPA